MNSKTFLIGIAGGIIVFLMGFLIYGILLMDYFGASMSSYPGLLKEPMEIWAIGTGNIIWGILLAYFLNTLKVESGIQGAIQGASLFFLFGLGANFVFFGQYNLMPLSLAFVDSLCMALLGGVSGSAIGWLLGRKSGKTS